MPAPALGLKDWGWQLESGLVFFVDVVIAVTSFLFFWGGLSLIFFLVGTAV